MIKDKYLLIGAWLLLAIFCAFPLIAIFHIPMIGDEPDDLATLAADVPGFLNFFDASRSVALSQSRLPFYLSAPVAFFFREHSTVPLRLLFYLFHLIYLVYSFKLVRLLTERLSTAWAYVLCVAGSCFLASFSVFSITTGDNLYLMFHVLSVYQFLRCLRAFQATHVFTGYLALSILLGLCIASKLFGVLLLLSFLVFHLLNYHEYKTIRVQAVHLNRTIAVSISFVLGLLLINLVHIDGPTKLGLALLLACFYLFFVINTCRRELKGQGRVWKVGLVRLWLAIGLTCLNLTLIFSPIYLNFANILKLFGYFDRWGSGLLIGRSHYYDMLIIVLMKYGLASCCALLVAGVILVSLRFKDKWKGFSSSPACLLVLVWFVHFVAISVVKHKVTWYPLAVFPFLYLPIVFLWDRSLERDLKYLKVLSLALFALVITDNCVRYVKWFPFGHFDGAQYGREYIGWNRAGFITFEALPMIVEDVIQFEKEPRTCIIQLVNVPKYNLWMAQLAALYLRSQGVNNIRLSVQQVTPTARFDYVVSSPVYYPEFEDTLKTLSVKRVKTFRIKGIDIVTLWARQDLQVPEGLDLSEDNRSATPSGSPGSGARVSDRHSAKER